MTNPTAEAIEHEMVATPLSEAAKERLILRENNAALSLAVEQYRARAEAAEKELFPYRLRLKWQKRPDGHMNADCPCGAAICGVDPDDNDMRIAEALHFGNVGNSELDEKRNRYNDKHRLAFAPENAEWLKKWWELSERVWDAARKAKNYYESTIVAAEVLPIQDAMRHELFKELFK